MSKFNRLMSIAVETEQNPNCGNSLVKSRVETDNSGIEPGADCGWRSIADEGTAFTRKNSPSGKSVSSPLRKNISLSPSGKSVV
jgi:hypothetical protein